jgi:Ca2+-binding RTX toxin-like protein
VTERIWYGAIALALLGAASVAVAPRAASHGGDRQCFGRAATIVGTAEADVLVGTMQSDVIVGAGGKDKVFGLGGDDFLCAGRSGSPKDYSKIQGGRGDDHILGNSSWLFRGGGGDDVIRGGYATAVPGPGDDVVYLTQGQVRYGHARKGITVDLERNRAWGQGRDILRGTFVIVWGSQFDDILKGDDRGNSLIGQDGNNVLVGRGGKDSLNGSTLGYDVAYGGAGFDTCYESIDELHSCTLWDD